MIIMMIIFQHSVFISACSLVYVMSLFWPRMLLAAALHLMNFRIWLRFITFSLESCCCGSVYIKDTHGVFCCYSVILTLLAAHNHIRYTVNIWLITGATQKNITRFLLVFIFSKSSTTKFRINLNPLDLELALTRDSVDLQMTFDLCDIIHHHTQSLVLAVKGLWMDLNGPPTSPLLSSYSVLIGALNGTLGPICECLGQHCMIDTERHKCINADIFLKMP